MSSMTAQALEYIPDKTRLEWLYASKLNQCSQTKLYDKASSWKQKEKQMKTLIIYK